MWKHQVSHDDAQPSEDVMHPMHSVDISYTMHTDPQPQRRWKYEEIIVSGVLCVLVTMVTWILYVLPAMANNEVVGIVIVVFFLTLPLCGVGLAFIVIGTVNVIWKEDNEPIGDSWD